jgi:hypothetical protein
MLLLFQNLFEQSFELDNLVVFRSSCVRSLADRGKMAVYNAVFYRNTLRVTFIQSQYLKALAASLRVGFCDEWKKA